MQCVYYQCPIFNQNCNMLINFSIKFNINFVKIGCKGFFKFLYCINEQRMADRQELIHALLQIFKCVHAHTHQKQRISDAYYASSWLPGHVMYGTYAATGCICFMNSSPTRPLSWNHTLCDSMECQIINETIKAVLISSTCTVLHFQHWSDVRILTPSPTQPAVRLSEPSMSCF
jgi:hypothetical protein